jgi:K+-sensing histidine kinase KdpD
MLPRFAPVTLDEDHENGPANPHRDGELNAIDRVMVCVSPNTFMPELIQAGADAASGWCATWYVVCVEPPGRSTAETPLRNVDEFQQNTRLAESLGATVVRVRAERPADGLIRFAEREGVTHVIFGQNARQRLGLLSQTSTKDRLLSELKGVAILELPSEGAVEKTAQVGQVLSRPSRWWWVGLAVFGVMAVVGTPAILLFAIAVVLAALWTRSLNRS